MRSPNLYPSLVNRTDNAKKNRFKRTFFLFGILMFTIHSSVFAQPSFQNGPVFPITVCPGDDISSYLGVNEPAGGLITWTILSGGGPSHGTLSTPPPYTATSVGGTGYTFPNGPIFYTPNDPSVTSDQIFFQATDIHGGPVSLILTITVSPKPSITVTTPSVSVCAGIPTVAIAYTGAMNVGPITDTFSYTAGTQTFNVPGGVSNVTFDVMGARGGRDNESGASNPGMGGRMQGNLAVSAGDVLTLTVGGHGGDPTGTNGATGGYPDGGTTSFYFYGAGGGGGGSSRIVNNNTSALDVVAGGGGGNGWDSNPGALAGGDGGGSTGGSSANNQFGSHATGGSQLIGGSGAIYPPAPAGMPGSSPTGGAGSTRGISGGGGGGYYGGGGGVWTGGGGGSSYFNPSFVAPGSVINTQGGNDTDGRIVIGYTVPGSTYSITWTGPAHNVFTDISGAPLTTSPFIINIPPTTADPSITVPVTYTGILTVNNSSPCASAQYPISLTVNPIPDVLVHPTPASPANPNQVVCNGQATADIDFATSVSGTRSFTWTNTNTTIDSNTVTGYILHSADNQHIGHFNGYNPTNIAAVDTFKVIMTVNGCSSAPSVFTITVNPTPTLNSTTIPPAVCNGTTFTYSSGSNTQGGPVTFAWSRAADLAGNPANGGPGGNIIDPLVNPGTASINVFYVDTIKANGCVNTQTLTVTVNPTPVFTSTLTPMPICDGAMFSYNPTSATLGTSYMWSRPADADNAANNGTNSPDEILINSTAAPIGEIYSYTLTAAGCTNVQYVTDSVYPNPMLTSSPVISYKCDSTAFTYVPLSNITGAIFQWSRVAMTGISNPATTGSGSITDTLVNNTAHPVVDTYTYFIITPGSLACVNTQKVTVTIEPRPLLTGSLSQPSVCDIALFTYVPHSFTVGTQFMWNRNVVAGISNGAATNSGSVSERLVNFTVRPVVDTYIYTMSIPGTTCTYVQDVTVTVNPKPLLSNLASAPAAICDSTSFVYSPASATPDSSFTWSRAYVPGILNIAATGTGAPDNYPSEELVNTTNVPVNVAYIFTISANGCSNSEVDTVSVNPTPLLTSAATGSVCSAAQFDYVPASFTPGAVYQWTRAAVTHITPATGAGSGDIHETLVNDTLIPVNVVYLFTLGINSCTNHHTNRVTVTVKANPPVPSVVIGPGHSLCSNTMYQNFGASTTSPSPVNYSWSAENATIWATGNTGQYAIVNFDNPGTAVIKLNSNLQNVTCSVSNTYSVTVTSAASDNLQVIYYDGQFICLQTNEGSYQWGYDDAGTLDSTLLAGETNQNYANTSPDFSHKDYWVMTTNNGCMQKTYYIVPAGVTDVNDVTGIKVYPNPTSDYINVDINTNINGDIQVEILNMLGQKVDMVKAIDHKAKISVTSLPSGVYLIGCYRDGVKIGTARFVKN